MSLDPPTSTSDSKVTASSGSVKFSIVPLSSPGTDSNYLDWSFVALVNLENANLAYVLQPSAAKSRAESWATDNKMVVSILTQIVSSANIRHMRNHREDACAMWVSLREAHQDSSAGGRMYWLRKLILTRMKDNDVESHLQEM